jgi:hypothetical protein
VIVVERLIAGNEGLFLTVVLFVAAVVAARD